MSQLEHDCPGGWPGLGAKGQNRSGGGAGSRLHCRLVPLALGLLLVLPLMLAGGCGPRPKAEAKAERPLSSEQEFRDKLAELRMQREKSVRAVSRLEERKAATVAFLKEKGVKSAADVAQDTSLKYAARELKGWSEEIDKLQQEVGHYDQAIKAIETMLAELERKRISESVALSEDEYMKLRKIVLDLNDRLEVDKQDVVEDAELDELLKEELGGAKEELGGAKEELGGAKSPN